MKKTLSRWKSNSFNKKTIILIGITGLFFLLLTYILSVFHSYCNADAGYYIGVSELINKGYVPYRDFQLGYTPLFFYIMQIPIWLMGNHYSYSIFLSFLYVITFASAVLIGFTIRKIDGSKTMAATSALIYLAFFYYLEGCYCILEGTVVFFGIISINLLLKKTKKTRILLSGFFAALAFLTKQYGLVFAASAGTLLIFSKTEKKQKIINCLILFIGFLFPIALTLVLFVLSGLSPKALIMSLSGNGYGSQTINYLFNGVIRALKLFPFLLLTPLLFYKKNNNRALTIACLIGLILSLLQFYFNDFSHYYIILLPFVTILSVLLWKRIPHNGIVFYIFFGVIFTSCAIILQTDYKQTKTMIKHNLRSEQLISCDILKQTAKKYRLNNCLCYMKTMPLYALYPIEPPALKKYAFSFGQDTDISMTERLNDAESLVISQSDWKSLKFLVFKTIVEREFKLVLKTNNINIYIRTDKLM